MNDNYMKTILSGVKEWTENLTDDAVDKANNALDKANNALDKALFVVNFITTDGETYSADKTFDEIVQAYNEGKYSIVANANGLTLYLAHFSPVVVSFLNLVENELIFFEINKRNKVFNASAVIATETSKLPNPYPLTFTGAVNETYDGSSAKTIEIPIGADGITPTIGDNGNWFLGDVDTNKPSRGEKGDTGAKGEKGDPGATGATGQSAYAAAQAGGYTDTEANFYADLAAMQGLASALAAI